MMPGQSFSAKAEPALQIRRVIEADKKWTRYGQPLRTSIADLRGDQKPRAIQRVS